MEIKTIIKVGVDGSISLTTIKDSILYDSHEFIQLRCYELPYTCYIKKTFKTLEDLHMNVFASNMFKAVVLGDVYLSSSCLNNEGKKEEYKKISLKIKRIANGKNLTKNTLLNKVDEYKVIKSVEELRDYLEENGNNRYALRIATEHDEALLKKRYSI